MSEGARFVDHAGALREPSRWGFNAYATVNDAILGAEHYCRHGAAITIWLLGDGLYDWSFTDVAAPWHETAEIVVTGHVRLRGSTNPRFKSYRLGRFIPGTPTATEIS
jgi:hypothetical protein